MNMETNYISQSFRQINNYERMILRKLKPIYQYYNKNDMNTLFKVQTKYIIDNPYMV